MMFSLRLVGEEEERFERLLQQFPMAKYRLARRIFMVGLSQVEAGADPLQPDSRSRFESLIEAVRADQEAARARDFNLALDNIETRAWLRTLGEILAPNSTASVKTKVINSRAHFLSVLEQMPDDAPVQK